MALGWGRDGLGRGREWWSVAGGGAVAEGSHYTSLRQVQIRRREHRASAPCPPCCQPPSGQGSQRAAAAAARWGGVTGLNTSCRCPGVCARPCGRGACANHLALCLLGGALLVRGHAGAVGAAYCRAGLRSRVLELWVRGRHASVAWLVWRGGYCVVCCCRCALSLAISWRAMARR